MAPLWSRCRDVNEGEDAVKKAGETYLPTLGGQDGKEYEAYKSRALFYNATARTIQAISGAIFRKPVQTIPDSPYVKDRAQEVIEEVFEVGRYGILVDLPKDGGEPYFVGYEAEQIINWRYQTIGDEEVLTMVVLREEFSEVSPDDSFVSIEKSRYRELILNSDGVYQQNVYIEEENTATKKTEVVLQSSTIPVAKGVPLNEIPFVFFGPCELSADPDKPPLLDLVNVNLSHYRTSADLEHGRHFTALPTAWVAGFDTETELRIGAGTAWVTNNVQARAGFLEFTGQGLAALEKAMEQKEHLMAVLGARLFESSKGGVEAAETVRLRQSADTATASSIANLVSRGLQKAYQWYLNFQLTPEGTEAVVKLNSDVIDSVMTSADAVSMVTLWQQGAISRDTMLWNLKRGEIIPDSRSIEDEAKLVDAEIGIPTSG